MFLELWSTSTSPGTVPDWLADSANNPNLLLDIFPSWTSSLPYTVYKINLKITNFLLDRSQFLLDRTTFYWICLTVLWRLNWNMEDHHDIGKATSLRCKVILTVSEFGSVTHKWLFWERVLTQCPTELLSCRSRWGGGWLEGGSPCQIWEHSFLFFPPSHFQHYTNTSLSLP